MNAIPDCKCGCGLKAWEALDIGFAHIVDELALEYPQIVWTSGPRCEKHNAAVGGSAVSGHLPIHGHDGHSTVAVDGTVKPWDEQLGNHILRSAIRNGATGVGLLITDKAFHIDIKPRRLSLTLWRVVKGVYEYFF